MKIRKILTISFAILLISFASYAQDNRTTETKVADLLARLPANDLQLNNKLMSDMLSLGESGIKKICDQIVPDSPRDHVTPSADEMTVPNSPTAVNMPLPKAAP